jgi:SAM-dependent methyltransferase
VTLMVDGNDFTTSLAETWPRFVGCPRRIRTMGPFLRSLITSGSYVLDAAMGTGCESVYLLQHGYRVVGNEISPALRDVALEYAKSQRVRLRVTSFDWRALADGFPKDRLNCVLVLGNSLCLLRDQEGRQHAVENFKRLCSAAGTVIIDERNFRYILQEREAILQGNFRYSGKVVFCGTHINGRPTIITDDLVRFEYCEASTRKIVGHLEMYPFRDGEIQDMFQRSGFRLKKIYSDLKDTYNKDADFYTYVFG